MLPHPSDEQQEIISHFKDGYNIKIEAVAGSGKTTTLLHIVKEARKLDSSLYVLLLTYNRKLKDEILQRVVSLGLDEYCHVYTYHGYASKIYRTNIDNDIKLGYNLDNKRPTESNYYIVLLDEVQDMSEYYYRLVTKILKPQTLLVMVGDRRQFINGYMGASDEYLINYDKYFLTSRPWKELRLRTSYRMTKSIADFVNKHVLREDLIIPGNKKNNNIKPIYRYGSYDIKNTVIYHVKKYGPDNVAILMPSIKNATNPKSPIGRLMSTTHDIIYHLNDRDSDDLPDIRGKVLITTYNSMKGNERDCIILLDFDESYFKFYDKKWSDPDKLPNILYVAATRAKEALVIINGEKEKPLRTVNHSILHETCQVHGGPAEKTIKDTKEKNEFTVTELIVHRHAVDVNNLLALLKVETVQAPEQSLKYNNQVKFDTYIEDVSKYYGTLIPLLAQVKLTGAAKFPTDIGNIKNSIADRFNTLEKMKTKTTKQWMEYVVLYTALDTGYYFLATQITNYDWIDDEFINIQVERIINKLKDKDGKFEDSYYIDKPYKLSGSFDYCDDNEIWEFKCTREIKYEHKLQCGAHISLLYAKTGKLLPCILYNTRTNEILRISVSDTSKYLELLARHKITFTLSDLFSNLKIN